MILVDAKYYGKQMRTARKFLQINANDAAQIFKIPKNKYKRYEFGREIFPESILLKIMIAAFSMLTFKKVKNKF